MEQLQSGLFEDLNHDEMVAIEGGNLIRGLVKLVEIIGVLDFLNDVGRGLSEGYKDGRKDFK